MKKRTHDVVTLAVEDDKASRAFDLFMMWLIVLNLLAVVLGSVQAFSLRFQPYFVAFELVSVVVFTLEYVARLWTCTEDERYRHPLWGRVRYALTPMAVIDLLSFLPFDLPLFVAADLRVLRGLRLFRLLRVLKFGRYSDSMQTLGRVLQNKHDELATCLFMGGILLLVASSLMYAVENRVQPDAFPNIPAAMWWGVATLTTVGYGDVYPVTPVGRLFGAVVAVLGVGMFALPAGILASGFAEELHKRKEAAKRYCPHCGREIL